MFFWEARCSEVPQHPHPAHGGVLAARVDDQVGVDGFAVPGEHPADVRAPRHALVAGQQRRDGSAAAGLEPVASCGGLVERRLQQRSARGHHGEALVARKPGAGLPEAPWAVEQVGAHRTSGLQLALHVGRPPRGLPVEQGTSRLDQVVGGPRRGGSAPCRVPGAFRGFAATTGRAVGTATGRAVACAGARRQRGHQRVLATWLISGSVPLGAAHVVRQGALQHRKSQPVRRADRTDGLHPNPGVGADARGLVTGTCRPAAGLVSLRCAGTRWGSCRGFV